MPSVSDQYLHISSATGEQTDTSGKFVPEDEAIVAVLVEWKRLEQASRISAAQNKRTALERSG